MHGSQALQRMGFGGYMPAPTAPRGGSEVGRFGASRQGHGGPVEVGYYSIDGYPQIGASPLPAMRLGTSSPQSTMQSPSFVGGRQVTDWQPTTDRVLWLGFKGSNIAAAANSAVSSSPQDTFAPRKVVIPGSVAPNFEVADLKIGAISQLSSSDPIPAEAFIPNASLTDVHFDTAKISQQVTFSVNNISNATATFRASMNGFVVR